ncbi:MAG TPA: hypothetical protein VGJ82_22055 [Thermoanaerobaculia bacterium]
MNPRFLAIGFVLFFLASVAVAQDAVTVGSATADGPTVDVPVYVRDAAGTPLGVDRPAGSKIQSFSIKVTYSPAAAVSAVTFTRAGITATLTPSFEISPASTGSISWVATFSESTAPIPFTSNAALPGNQVAHLLFTLNSSATPGSSIALTLDTSTTQLSNQGGTTSETSSTGLSLVNGSIQIPVPSLTVTPPSQIVNVGTKATLLATTNVNVVSNTTVSLASSNPAVGTVPASVVITAGTHSASFQVTTLSAGGVTITATLPPASGGGTSSGSVTVNPAPACTTPAVPQIGGPATAVSGASYDITWPAVPNATEYIIDEATDAAFATAVPLTVTATTATYSHSGAGSHYYYRVRARNHAGACDLSSQPSSTVSVLITAPDAPPQTRVFTVVGSTPGNFGSYFKTAVQLYNPRTQTISGKIVFHTQATSGSASDPSLAYSIAPGKTLAFADLLPAMGIASGLGSADIVSDVNSALPVALSRVFNDGGAAGTTGLSQEALSTDDALQQGSTAVLFAPTDVSKFRLNIGVRTLAQGAAVSITVRDRDGAVVKTVSKTFDGTYFRQFGSADFLDGYNLTGGETITIEVSSGSAFFYGATTDNVTNDPSVQTAEPVD